MKKNIIILSLLLVSCKLFGQSYDTTKTYPDRFYNSWEDAAEMPKCVVNLNLYRRGYDTISPLIKNMTNLKLFYFKSNRIDSLPDEIGYLHKLTRLNFSRNRLHDFPKTFWNLKNLEELDLSYNRFVVIPEDIGKLTKLKKLFLQNNRLKKIPAGIGELQNLEILNLSNNKLTDIPPELYKLTKLKVLLLDGNYSLDPKKVYNLRHILKDTQIIF